MALLAVKEGSKSHPGPPFVGREAELARFGELGRAVASGRGAVIAISGDHGTGKTRLAREVIARAERTGATTLWGQGYDDEGSPAYWPWAEIITHYIDRRGLAHARRLMGAGAYDVASLIPSLERVGSGAGSHVRPGQPHRSISARGTAAGLAPSWTAPREPPTHEARFRLFAAMRAFLQRAAGERPLLIVLDDLHYCDPDTLLLFEAVAGDLESSRLLLVGTYVERRAARHAVLPRIIASVSKLPWYREVPVGNLTLRDVRALLEPQVGRSETGRLASSVHKQTEGNALLVVEAVHRLAARVAAGEKNLSDDHWEEGASPGVSMLISRRLARLSPASLEALQAAAVLGREFDLDVLAATIHAAPAAARALLAGSVDDGLLGETAPDRYRFGHELVQRAVAADLAPADRAAIHLAAGEALEALRASGIDVDPARIARHFGNAGSEHRKKACRYAREAGERALDAAAYDTALRAFDEAAGDPGLSPGEQAGLAMLRAWTLFALTRFAEVAPRLAEAFNLYLSVGDIAHAVDAAEFATYPQGAERLPREQIRGLREQALALVPPESPEAARLLCALAETYSYAHRGRAEECLARATELARRFADRRLEARIHYARAWLQYRNLEWPLLLESAAEALETARAIADRNLELLFGGRLVLWKLLCGDPDGAGELALALRGGVELGPSLWTDDLQGAERVLAIWTGRWKELGRRLEERKWLAAPGTVRGPARRPASAGLVAYNTPEVMLAYQREHPQIYINPDQLAMRANMLADACADQGNESALPAVREVAERALSMELSPLGRLFAQSALGFVGYLQQDAALLERACGPEMLSRAGRLHHGVTGLPARHRPRPGLRSRRARRRGARLLRAGAGDVVSLRADLQHLRSVRLLRGVPPAPGRAQAGAGAGHGGPTRGSGPEARGPGARARRGHVAARGCPSRRPDRARSRGPRARGRRAGDQADRRRAQHQLLHRGEPPSPHLREDGRALPRGPRVLRAAPSSRRPRGLTRERGRPRCCRRGFRIGLNRRYVQGSGREGRRIDRVDSTRPHATSHEMNGDASGTISAAVESIYRSDSRRVLATLIRLLGDFDLAEEALHEAFGAALAQWPRVGLPANPRAWLVSAGRFKAIDVLRRRARFDASVVELAARLDAATPDAIGQNGHDVEDDRLRLIFTCCHPAIPPDAQVALTLREVCGLTTEEIARAFLVEAPTLAQRIVRAKARVREARIPYEVPALRDLPERLDSVLRVIYLVFTEGYWASSGTSLTRRDLSGEAIRLGRLLVELLPDPEALGLLALMLLNESRRAARTTPGGELVLLEEQDRSLWDRGQIAEGAALVERALHAPSFGPYTIQAAIAAVHAESPGAASTDWAQIGALYDILMRSDPSPIVELNRGVAVGMRDGPAAGLALIEAILARGDLLDYHLAHAARADMLRRLGRKAEALASYRRALDLARQEPERRFLERRLRELSE